MGTVPVAPRQAKIDAPARPVKAIRPDYPKGARQRGEEGDVVLEMAISSRGAVESVRTVRSRLMERIADPSLPPCDIFLPAQLVVRGSTERGVVK